MHESLLTNEPPPARVPSPEAILIEARLQKIRSSYPNVVSGIGGKFAHIPSKQIDRIEASHDDKPTGINPGTGVIASMEQELVTEKLWGCAVLYLTNGECQLFVHMNPNNALPYRPWRKKGDHQTIVQHWEEGTVNRIVDALKEVDDDNSDVAKYHGVFIINAGHANKSSPYSQELLDEDSKLFVSALEQAGIANVRVVTLPMDETALYRSPARPDEVFVIGKRQQYDSRGYLEDVPGVTAEEWISIKGKD